MSAQQSFIFDSKRLARSSDPQSSKAAAQKMVETGALRGQAQTVYNALKRHPGLSSKELALRTGLDRYMVARRLSDLWHLGKVLKVEIGKKDCRWYVIL